MNIDICICTFRRPHIADTLRSLAELNMPPGGIIHVIIADNDDTPAAKPFIEEAATRSGLSFTYLHAPARNISLARNACLNAVTGDYVAFIDDDESASHDWLNALLETLTRENTDIVLGPVLAMYDSRYAGWLKKGDFHSTYPTWVQGTIITGYSCNVLFKRLAPALQGLRFQPELGQTGGEDTVFFSEAVKNGAKIAYAPEAIVTEIVPLKRATFWWLIKRRFRYGQTHGVLLHKPSLVQCATAAAKAFYCFCIAALYGYDGVKWRFWLLRASLHIGVIAQLLGISASKTYGVTP